jgi:Ca2+-binding RTX toxin-like protein
LGGHDIALRGLEGDDRIIGGPGDDNLYGGPGADTFVYTTGSGWDRIHDFQPGIDKLEVKGTTYSAVVSYDQSYSGVPGEMLEFFGRSTGVHLHGITEKPAASDFIFA